MQRLEVSGALPQTVNIRNMC